MAKISHKLQPEEWDFSAVPNEELVACCYWEYARESAFIRDLRQRSLDHWMPLYKKARWWDSPQKEDLFRDLEKVQSIGYPAEVFLRGISCPPDDVLPDMKKPSSAPAMSLFVRAISAAIGTDRLVSHEHQSYPPRVPRTAQCPVFYPRSVSLPFPVLGETVRRLRLQSLNLCAFRNLKSVIVMIELPESRIAPAGAINSTADVAIREI